MKIKVPFKTWKVITEKEIDFIFRIGTLEDACDILGCDLWEVEKQNPYDVNVAILFAGYKFARNTGRKNKFLDYNLNHAVFWMEHMSKDSQGKFLKAVQDLLGKMTGKKEEKKK